VVTTWRAISAGPFLRARGGGDVDQQRDVVHRRVRDVHAVVEWRKLKLKAKFESGSSYLSFKRLVTGAFNMEFIGSTFTARPLECVSVAAHAAASFTGLQGLKDSDRHVIGCRLTQETRVRNGSDMTWRALSTSTYRVAVLVHGGHLEGEDLAHHTAAHQGLTLVHFSASRELFLKIREVI